MSDDDLPTQAVPAGAGDGEHGFADAARRYRLDSRLATGGMGEVWRATDTTLGRQVAVKLLKLEYAEDPTFRRRFETEAQHAASLHHPGIAAVYDFGEAPTADGSGLPRPYLVMELVEGQPLSALLRPGQPMDPEVASDLMAQTATALAAAHAAGIVHRDVKPANLLVTPDRRVKVTDFGIARAADSVGVTQTGQVMGTPQYLSPEQARGNQATAASDVYALGVVAFECLAGRRPFQTDSPVTTALAHLNQPVPELPAAVPTALAAVVRRALAKEPAERWPDATAFAAALRDPRGTAGPAGATSDAPTEVVGSSSPDSTQVLPAGAGAAAGLAAGAAAGAAGAGAGAAAASTPADGTPAPGTTTTTTTTGGGGSGRRPWAIALMALLLAAVAALIIVLLVTSGDDEEEPEPRPTREPSPTSSSAEPTPTPEPEPTPTEPATVTIELSDYTGRQVREVEADLRGQGLNVTLDELENDGSQEQGVVDTVNPTGTVQEGATITVSYWGEPPAPTPTPEPTPTETPSETPTTTPTERPAPTAPTGAATDGATDGASDQSTDAATDGATDGATG